LQKYDIFLIYKEKIKIYSAIWQFFIRQFGSFSFGNLAVFHSAIWQFFVRQFGKWWQTE